LFDCIEILIAKHFENNFFLSSETKKVEDLILHENYIKDFNDERRFNFNYSVYCLFSIFKLLDSFQDYKLKEIYDPLNSININQSDTNKPILTKIFKEKKNDIVIYFIKSHINNIIEDVNNSTVINVEAEQKLCFSLFIIKKIIKDFSFYFSLNDLDDIFKRLKHLKE